MKILLILDIIRFSLSQNGIRQQLVYLIKGITFFFFLNKKSNRLNGDEVSTTSQAGDDIYPIF